jgi:ADP-ribose pyrophosphatase
VVEQQAVYTGRVIRVIREVLQIRKRRIIRETIHHPGAVVIVPLLNRTRVVMVRQYRRAVNRELLELPAGTLEAGEAREACARRELEEETGWRARRWRRIAQFYAAPGFCSEQLTVFLAEDLTPSRAQPEPDEDVRPVVLSLRQALAQIASGAICDAKTIIGLLTLPRLVGSQLVSSKRLKSR